LDRTWESAELKAQVELLRAQVRHFESIKAKKIFIVFE
jgi:hypothetical protein